MIFLNNIDELLISFLGIKKGKTKAIFDNFNVHFDKKVLFFYLSLSFSISIFTSIYLSLYLPIYIYAVYELSLNTKI